MTQRGYIRLNSCGIPLLGTFSQDATLSGKVGWYSITIQKRPGQCTTYTIDDKPYEIGAGLYLTAPNIINVGTASSDRIVINADNIDLATTGVTAGTYNSVTVDEWGRITSGSSGTPLIATAPLSYDSNTGVISISQADTDTDGYLTSTDWNTFNNKESSLTFSTGLTRVGDVITSNISTGISGGQTIYGGTGATENLTILSTTHSNKGKVMIGSDFVVDGATGKVGIGTVSPLYLLDVSYTSIGAVGQAIVARSTNNAIDTGVTISAINTAGSTVGIAMYEPLFGANDLGGNGFIFSYTNLILGSSANVSSGGTHSIQFRTGGFAQSQERGRILSNGRWLIGTTTDAGELFQVNGTARITSSTGNTTVWNTSGIPTITAAGGVSMPGAVMHLANSSITSPSGHIWSFGIQAFGGGTGTAFIIARNGTAKWMLRELDVRVGGTLSNQLSVATANFEITGGRAAGGSINSISLGAHPGSGGTFTGTNASWNTVSIGEVAQNAFNPTSSNYSHNGLYIAQTINMTGTATGIATAIKINPTLTALASGAYYGIHITGTSTSHAIYQDVSGSKNYFAGFTGIGGVSTSTDRLELSGNLALMVAGNKIKIATGSNASAGQSTLASGTVTVNTTAVTASSKIFFSVKTASGTAIGGQFSYTITASTSFTVTSLKLDGTTETNDNSTFDWWLIN